MTSTPNTPSKTLFTALLHDDPVPLDNLSECDYPTAAWLAQAFTRQALQKEELPRAIKAAIWLVGNTKRPCVIGLNLIARFLLAHGETATALQILERSLRIAPRQKDVLQWHAAARAGAAIEITPPDLEIFPKRATAIGFYLPVFNAAPFLPQVLPSILRQAHPLDALLIVDDGSTDNSREIAAGYPAELVAHDENKGLAAARNTAFNTLPSEYIATCDSDARLHPCYLLHLDLELRDTWALKGLGGRMTEVYSDTPPDRYRDIFLSQDTSTQRRHWNNAPASLGLPNIPGTELVDELYLPGCNTMFHRQTVLDLGGYDERYIGSCEDGDLYNKMKRAGHAMSTVPEARVFHLRRDTTRSVLDTDWRYNYRTRLDNGVFSDTERLHNEIQRLPERYYFCKRHPATRDTPELHFLYLALMARTFVNLLSHAEVHGGISSEKRQSLQIGLASEVYALDTKWGGNLQALLKPLLDGHWPNPEQAKSCQGGSESMPLKLLDLIAEPIYRTICAYDEERILPPLVEEEHLK